MNKSKKKDSRFELKWLLSGAEQEQDLYQKLKK